MEPIMLYLTYFALLNLAVVLAGYWFVRNAMVWQSWVLLAFSIYTIHMIFLNESAIIRMLALIATTFTAMKVIAAAESYKGKLSSLSFRQWTVFAIGWAGMRAQPFETLGDPALPDAWPKIRFGISRVLAGLVLILVAHQLVTLSINPYVLYLMITAILLLAFSLILHFGLLSISAGMWRLSGVGTYYLFKTPAKAKTLNEFWSKRWNLAFSEMTSVTIFRPLKDKIGAAAALMIAFVFSGLLHELALSVPVNSGYGFPLLYFIIQGIAVIAEKALIKYKIGFLQHRQLARIWVFFWVVIPTPLLFHTQFISSVIWPLSGITIK
ncbi:MAG TPA: MBOAT family protein [Pedobacter sp.]|uniref:MBOAT family protein n=1 Tax=Pedobacter sp. TaxID=1411316 RepID=UPI002C27B3E8|nr:MBOAT family protein [Pedobacter sp.]HMI04903.1 MBOAT family protein [Pedobacter sp.]